MGSAEDERHIIEGLAALAITLAEMGATDAQAGVELVGWLQALGVTDPAVVLAAAEEVARSPQPIDESPEQIQRRQPIREMLGVVSAEEHLLAMLQGKEWLERLAESLAES